MKQLDVTIRNSHNRHLWRYIWRSARRAVHQALQCGLYDELGNYTKISLLRW